MQSVFRFDSPSTKRRKQPRACHRCRRTKKRCTPVDGISGSCERCVQDERPCSFASELLSPASLSVNSNVTPTPATNGGTELSGSMNDTVPSNDVFSAGASQQYGPQADVVAMPSVHGLGVNSELRYSTMLDILQSNPSRETSRRGSPTKLIGDTNPLSALLRKELKHKIVNNLCGFRAPDPPLSARRPSLHRLPESAGWDWESYYARYMHPAKLQYAASIGCFRLPNASQSGQLLDIFFARVYPILPVIDRKDFLARFYSPGDPPPLILILAVYLAAARYCANAFGDHTNVREVCDSLHSQLRALIDVDILLDRFTVLQAMVLCSLHWEGREGVNSSIDALSMGVRIAQEMGIHRHGSYGSSVNPGSLSRRIWWCLFAFDRLNAATEGQPFIVNELDCDAPHLCDNDFEDESDSVREVTLANLELAMIVQDAVRSLYSPHLSRESLHSRFGVSQRDRITRDLNRFEGRLAGLADTAFGRDQSILEMWSTLFHVHTNAVRLLVHRPFLLYYEANPGSNVLATGSYRSRDQCRAWAFDTIDRLKLLRTKSLLHYSWPFTVYSLVNALLITWYDYSAPPSDVIRDEARRAFVTIIGLLRHMGNTWWAAAAKNKLAEALLRVGDRVRDWTRTGIDAGAHLEAGKQGVAQPYLSPTPATNESNLADQGQYGLEFPGDLGDFSSISDDPEFWTSLGIDFDTELAAGIFSIV